EDTEEAPQLTENTGESSHSSLRTLRDRALNSFTYEVGLLSAVIQAALSKTGVWADCPATQQGTAGLLLSKYRWDKDLLLERFLLRAREPEELPWRRHNTSPAVSGVIVAAAPPSPAPRHRRRHSGTHQRCAATCSACVDCYRSYVAQARMPPGRPVRGPAVARVRIAGALLDEPVSWCCACLRAPRSCAAVPEGAGHQLCHLQPPAWPLLPRGRLRVRCAPACTTPCAGLRVTAACGKRPFCFACALRTGTSPSAATMLRRWQQKNAGESMSTQWFMANTKECPKCHATIEKNGRLQSQMKMPQCHLQSRILLGLRMDDMAAARQRVVQLQSPSTRSRAERVRRQQALSRNYLSRYLHYYDLYMNHLKSLEFEARLQETVHSKMDEMQYHGLSWIEVKFLRDAVAVLCNCRRVLMYTYVFAYYLKPSNQQKIFETISEFAISHGRSQRGAGTGNAAGGCCPAQAAGAGQVRGSARPAPPPYWITCTRATACPAGTSSFTKA
uniref:Ariadne domain-containing protein n=1 Tax=Macrostomum lignano TaxID=282301 RepID=A0A1I8FL38_9PLAT